LTGDEVFLMNPNTGSLPMFRTRVDADITLGIYTRLPILIREDESNGNAWQLAFSQGLFNMASDSHLFQQAADLADSDFDGWSRSSGIDEYFPLYEAKMLNIYDHRFSTYRGATQAQLNVGALPRLTDKEHDDPDTEPVARYWVDRKEVQAKLGAKWDRAWLLSWRLISNTGNERTFVPTVFPRTAIGNASGLAYPANATDAILLHATFSTLAFDYVVRQKLSGSNMTFTLVKQIACPLPTTFAQPTPWFTNVFLSEWLYPYILELSYTSWRLKPYAEDFGDQGPPFGWDSERRALLRADVDACFMHVYGLNRTEADHVLDSFNVIRRYEERDFGEYRTKRLVLDAYDRMAQAIANGGKDWEPLADPPAGQGPRHPNRT
jgi:hypothetical protein